MSKNNKLNKEIKKYAIALLVVGVDALLLMSIWNNLFTDLVEIREITYIESFEIYAIAKILTSKVLKRVK